METIVLAFIGLALYLLPGVIAYHRRHRSINAIMIVNLIFGWTVIGWLWALIWANTGNVEAAPTRNN